MSPLTSWTGFRRRSTALATVVESVEQRRDGRLPHSVPAPFADELDLIGALTLRWHSRLTARLEEHLSRAETVASAPSGAVRHSVASAWAAAARDLPGLRLLLDRQLAEPATPAVGRALARATAKERQLLAARAGFAGRIDGGLDPDAVESGRRIEAAARGLLAEEGGTLVTDHLVEARVELVPAGSAAFVARVKAVLAA